MAIFNSYVKLPDGNHHTLMVISDINASRPHVFRSPRTLSVFGEHAPHSENITGLFRSGATPLTPGCQLSIGIKYQT